MMLHQHDGKPWFEQSRGTAGGEQRYSRSMHTEYDEGVALRVTVDGNDWAYISICDSEEGTPEHWATVMYGRPKELRKALLAHARFLDMFDDKTKGQA